jgi:AcrR family transcriptional regulator
VNRSSARLRDRQREAVSAALLDAAEEVIAARGMPEAGMVEIAKRAGVAVGTLYNYFTDRDGLVRALLDARRNAIAPRIKALLADSKGPFETRLRGFIRSVLALFEENRRFVKLSFEVDAPLAHKGKSRAVTETLRSCLHDLLVAGVAEGVIANRDVTLRVRLLASCVRSVVVHELQMNGAFTTDADAIVDLFLDGARR